MDIPLLSKEEVEKENGSDLIDIRDQLIEFLQSKGYKYVPTEEEFEEETTDLFIKEDQLIDITITDNIPKEVLEQMSKTD